MDTDTDTDMDTDIDTNTDTGTEIDTETRHRRRRARSHHNACTLTRTLSRTHSRTHARTDNTRHEAHPSQLGVLHAAGPNMVLGMAHLYLSSMNVRNKRKNSWPKNWLAPKKEHPWAVAIRWNNTQMLSSCQGYTQPVHRVASRAWHLSSGTWHWVVLAVLLVAMSPSADAGKCLTPPKGSTAFCEISYQVYVSAETQNNDTAYWYVTHSAL